VSERKWDWPDTPAARQNLETLSALARAIGMAAAGRFVLLLAKCNVPAQQEVLAEQLRAMLEPLDVELVEVDVAGAVSDLLSHLKAHLEPSGRPHEPAEAHRPEPVEAHRPEPVEARHPELVEGSPLVQLQPATAVAEPRVPYSAYPPLALSVHGLAASFRSDDPHPPLLAHLNLGRECYRELGCPLVLWLPDYALTRLAREAPDFWAWRSGVFEFVPQPEMAESALRQVAYEPELVTSSLDAAAKRERLMLLEQLLVDYRELGAGPREQDVQADILWKMGGLHQDLGEYEAGRQAYREALEIKQQLGDRAGVAQTLHQLGNVAYLQGDYAEARRLYGESLDIAQQLGNRAGLAATLHQLGMLAQGQGDYVEARRLYQESLDIKQEMGDHAGIAATLHQLGMLAQAQGDYAEARRLYGESLDIAQQLGNRAGLATTLHQLGMLAQDQGDYAEARRLYQESFDIKQQLGDRAGIAITLAQLALLEEAEGNLERALDLTRQAQEIIVSLGNPEHIARIQQQRTRLEEKLQGATPGDHHG